MATKKFLDLNGLDYFWGKIKAWVNSRMLGKQDKLVSGVNIKTVNNESLLGRGNIEIQGGGGTSDYSDLENKPQINSVELSGDKSSSDLGLQSVIDEDHKLPYSYISGTPTIPDAQIQSDWNQSDNTKKDYIKNKPTIPDVSNYVQKSETAGLLKNDGTVDTTSYGTYSKPSGGIPASDLASGVIPSVPVQDVTVGGTSVVSSGTAVIPQEVFWATYGTTTHADVLSAYNANKCVLVFKDGYTYRLEYIDNNSAFFSTRHSQLSFRQLTLTSGNVWSESWRTVETDSNKVSTIVGYETSTTKYPNTKAVADYVTDICGNILTILQSI